MDLSDINLSIQDDNFVKELKDFNTLRSVDEIPDYKKVLKFKKHQKFYEKLCIASLESNGDMKFTNKRLGQLFKLSERQVSRIINHLQDVGLISCLRVKGFNGTGLRYNRHGDSGHKSLARSRYWTCRTIRIHMILAINCYRVKFNLGWKNDFRPKPNLDIEEIRKAHGRRKDGFVDIIANSLSTFHATKRKIPLKYKITKELDGVDGNGKPWKVKPVFASKVATIARGYVWPTFFQEHEYLSELRAAYGGHDDPDVQNAIGLLGYSASYRIKRNFAILKRQKEQAIVV